MGWRFLDKLSQTFRSGMAEVLTQAQPPPFLQQKFDVV